MIVEAISDIRNHKTKLVAYANELTAAGCISELKVCWNILIKRRPKFGYYAQRSKSLLIVKEKHVETAKLIVNNIKVNIATDGKRHLGVIIGSEFSNKDALSRSELKVCSFLVELHKLFRKRLQT